MRTFVLLCGASALVWMARLLIFCNDVLRHLEVLQARLESLQDEARRR